MHFWKGLLLDTLKIKFVNCIFTLTGHDAYEHCMNIYGNIKIARIMNDTILYFCFG